MSDSIDSILDDQAEEETEELANQVISDNCFKRELFISLKWFFSIIFQMFFPFMFLSQAVCTFFLLILFLVRLVLV
jgi:hypothetical protein